MDGIGFSELKVNAIEYVLFVAFGMDDLELGRVKKPSGVQATDGNEVAEFLIPEGQREATRSCTERAIRGRHAARRSSLPKS